MPTCIRCGKPTEGVRTLCASCYSTGKTPDTAPVPPKKKSKEIK